MTPVLAAVLVNYNAGDELRRALQSIADEMGDQPWEGVVVDNCSSDGSAETILSMAPVVRLIRNTQNVGFGRGVNQGVAATTAPLILVMNPDCRLVAGAMATLRADLLAHDQCAMVAPKILNPDGSVQGSARGDPDMLTGVFGRTAAIGRLLRRLPMAARHVPSEDILRSGTAGAEVDWVSGACFVARREALTQVRGFDERYFLYWEDADLCKRLRLAGWRIRYVTGASAIHRVGHSSKTAKAASIRAFHESAYLYYTTHVATRRLSPKRPLARLLLACRQAWHRRGTTPPQGR